MNSNALKIICLSLLIAILINVCAYDYTSENSYSHLSDIEAHKSNLSSLNSNLKRGTQLDTTTEFIGETIYVSFSNESIAYIKSNYTYVSINNISHSLNITIGDSSINVSVYMPFDWNYTSISPIESVSVNETDYTCLFNATQTSTVYEIEFNSGNTYGLEAQDNTYVCLENVSSTYSMDSSFESSYSDWQVYDSQEFSDMALNTSVSFKGNKSFRLENNESQTSCLYFYKTLTQRSFYFTFSYMYESITEGNISLLIYNGVDWLTYETKTETKRFHKLFAYGNYYSLSQTVRLDTISNFTGVFFIDCFEIWIPSIEMTNTDTIDYYNVSSSLISWDLYNNYAVSSETVYYYIYIRHNQTLIDNTMKTTNETGISVWNLNLDLKEIEYTINAYSSYPFIIEEEEEEDEMSWNPSELLIELNLEEGAGTTFEDTSNNFDCEGSGTGWEYGYRGYWGVSFERASFDYGSFGDNDAFTFNIAGQDIPFSVETWIKFDSICTQGIISKYGTTGYNEWIFYMYVNKIYLYLYDPISKKVIYAYTDITTFETQIWYHLVATYDGSETKEGITLFVNTVNETTRATSGTYNGMGNTAQPLELGRYSNTNFLDGVIDNIRVFNKTLNQTEINYLYQLNLKSAPSVNETLFFTSKITNNFIYINDFWESKYGEWDFSSEDRNDDDFVDSWEYDSSFITASAQNGTLDCFISSTSNTWLLFWYFEGINANYYNKMKIVIRGSEDGLRFVIKDDVLNLISSTYTISTVFTEYDFDLDSTYWKNNEQALVIFFSEVYGAGGFDLDEIFYIEYIRLYHEDLPVKKEAQWEWWLTSQNDSYTYVYSLDGVYSTCMDLQHISKKHIGIFDLTFCAYLDSNYQSTVLIPSETYIDTITVSSAHDNVGLNHLITLLIQLLFTFGIIFIGLLILAYILRRVFFD